MKKFIKNTICFVLTVTMLLGFAAPALAAKGVDHPDFNKETLRKVILDQKSVIKNITDSLNGLVHKGYVKGLIKSAITDLLDISSLVSDNVGPFLGDLIDGAVGRSIGVEIPASIDVGGIVDSIIANEIVNDILTGDFFASVFDKTIDNVLNTMDSGDMTAAVIDMLLEDIINQLVDDIWNDGNPYSQKIIVEIGHWKTSGGWNNTRIGIDLLAKVSGGVWGMIRNPDSVTLDPAVLIPPAGVLTDAVWNAITDTTKGYYNRYKTQIEARIREAVANLLEKEKVALVNRLNECFAVALFNEDMSFEEIAAAAETVLLGMNAEKRELLIGVLKDNLSNLYNNQSGICGFISELMERCEGCKDNPPVALAAETIDTISLAKTVLDGDDSIGISIWLMFNKLLDWNETETIFDDVTFEVCFSNKAGANLGKVTDVTGKIEIATSQIIFYDDATGEPHDFATGWYLVREVMGKTAAAYFQNVDDLLIYFNEKNGAISADSDPEFSADTYFTIKQFKDETRPLQALYRDAEGTVRYLRGAPALDVVNRPNNGGGALGTSRFEATQDDGTQYMSFCADIGALLVNGKYYVDEDNHGLSDDEVLQLVAALDFIYARSGFANYEDIALAQIVIWNMILNYSDDPMIADLWLRDIAAGIRYTEAWGELFKIEGFNHESGINNWYTPEYKAIIDDILANAYNDTYVNIYKERIADGAETYVSGAVFLKGDGSQPDYFQQRQVVILFGEPITFDNVPKEDDGFIGIINLLKTVTDGNDKMGIAVWLMTEKGLSFEEIEALLGDISFEIYYSDNTGAVLGKAVGVTGTINTVTNQITFYDNATGNPHDFDEGWYLVREVMGEDAAKIFQNDVPDLLIYYDGGTAITTAAGQESTTIADDMAFTITQFKDETRPLQALYRDTEGTVRYLRGAPALDVANRPNNGGGALGTSRFLATADDGKQYMSFCADIGALLVKGKYYVDKDNHGLSDDEVRQLVAALDFIYARSGFAHYEDIALAQLVVWNMVLAYSDDPMIADLWLRDIAAGIRYTEAWGELIKIEGFNHESGVNNWYTPAYRTIIDDILANLYTDKYLNIYESRIADGAETYVSGAVFLKGDGSQPDYFQQRQVVILFGEPPIFDNRPKDQFTGNINLRKTVLDGETGIAVWLMTENGLGLDEIDDLLGDISFEIYASNDAGDELGVVAGVTGKLEMTSQIIFYDDTTGSPHGFSAGWYLVREVMGYDAKTVFKDGIADLLIYFDAETETVKNAGGEEPVFNNLPVDKLGALKVIDGLVEAYIVEYHKPVYEISSYDGSLSSVAPESNNMGNWFRHVAINVETAKNEGVKVEIAKSGSGKYGIEGINYDYTVTIDDDGHVVLSFDNNLISTAVHAKVFTSKPSDFGNNGGHVTVGPNGVVTANAAGTSSPFMLPEDVEEIYLYVHFEGLTFYTTDGLGERTVSGCQYDYEEGPLTREFSGDVDISVIVYKGTEIVYSGPLGQIGNLAPDNDYKVELYVDDVLYDTAANVVVKPNMTVEVDFGDVTVNNGNPASIIVCGFCQD